jgi:hypothetical protein
MTWGNGGRLWLHVSIIPTAPGLLLRFVPSQFIRLRTGPAIPPDQAQQTGFSFVQIVPDTEAAFANALITEVGFPALDGASKDASKMTIQFGPGLTLTRRWPPFTR